MRLARGNFPEFVFFFQRRGPIYSSFFFVFFELRGGCLASEIFDCRMNRERE